MLEQELKPGARQGRTLRETERRRVLRNRILGTSVVVSLVAALFTAVRRALPQWLEMPGNAANTAQAKQTPAPSENKSVAPTATAMRSNVTDAGRLRTSAAKSTPKTQPVRRALFPAGLGPVLLPADEPDAPRRHHRRRATRKLTPEKATPQQPAAANAPSKHAQSDAPAPKPADPTPAPPNSKPPDDVPDNP